MILKTKKEIEIMAEAGQRLGRVLHALRAEVRPGITTKSLDTLAHSLITEKGDMPAFLHYRPTGTDKAYPATLCTSVNDVVVHGVPDARPLAEGDLVKLDLGLIHKEFYVDAAITVPVGRVSAEAQKLIAVTREALARGIAMARPGNTVGDIGFAVQTHVEQNGFSVVRMLTGHGVGRALHEDPMVFNYGTAGTGEELEPGLVIAIEPMVNVGGSRVRQRRDDSFVARDGSLSAHFEHTVAITEAGPRILTLLPDESA